MSLETGPDSYSYHIAQYCAELIKKLSKNLVNWFFILLATCTNAGRSRIHSKLTAGPIGQLLFPVSENFTQSSKKKNGMRLGDKWWICRVILSIQGPWNQKEKETKTCRVQTAVLEFLRLIWPTHITSKATTTFSFYRRLHGILQEDHLTLFPCLSCCCCC